MFCGNRDLYKRVNKELVSIDTVTSKYDVMELRDMIRGHVDNTGSAIGKEILDNFSEYLPKFKEDLYRMNSHIQTAIVHMEEKVTRHFHRAQIEAFYASKKRG